MRGVSRAPEVRERAASTDGPFNQKQAAAYLGCSVSFFKEHIRDELPVLKHGRRPVYERKDLDEWRRNHKADGNCDSQRVAIAKPGLSGFDTTANGSNAARAEQIKAKLLSRRREYTRT
jgi:hypothetical protein